MDNTELNYLHVESPIGCLLLIGNTDSLSGLYMEKHKGGPLSVNRWRPDAASLRPYAQQLDEYFAGRRTAFELPLSLAGTDFQRKVWKALLEIPSGQTVSYAEVARRIGAPNAVRAVGAAVGSNPVSIIVPCHRVVGSDGSLRGFGGGLDRKRWLLAHEGSLAALGNKARGRQAELAFA